MFFQLYNIKSILIQYNKGILDLIKGINNVPLFIIYYSKIMIDFRYLSE